MKLDDLADDPQDQQQSPLHDVRTRSMGDQIVVDATLTVETGHDIAV